ncbi:TPA: carbohydrate kinase family protein, partial [Candidatus Bathyarchaeota archaeon]|nr:carbohydrate kinase family protein [Candidatus Bathyarchaeota archaeon]
GAMIFFDPGCLFVEKGMKGLKEILALSTVVKLNKVEAARLTGEKDTVKGAKKIRKLGPEVILVTLGSEGCYILTKELETRIPAYLNFKPLDKTGAGDAFDAGFLAGFLKGWSVEESVKFGNLVAGISITKVGARTVPTINELKTYPEAKEFRLEVK